MRIRLNETLASLAIVAVGTVFGSIGGILIGGVVQGLLIAMGVEGNRAIDEPLALLSFIAGALVGAFVASVQASSVRRMLESRRKPVETSSDSKTMWWDEPDDTPGKP